MTEIIRVLITDDHLVVRKGLAALLATKEDIEVIGEAENGKEAIEKVRELSPDVILMDLVMPEMDGVQAIKQIVAEFPEAKILVMTSFATDDMVFPAIKSGALGYLLKDSTPEELVGAIRQVYQGEPSLHPKIARKVLMEISNPTVNTTSEDPLTERELGVLKSIAKGMSNQEIGLTLSISETTVRTHVSRILNKLHLASRTQAALYALKEGLANLDDDVDFD
ncbi:MAG TPA: response regulator transcription factor [Anaerolineales bacterium]|nr:response regulator transcription factor [Anaerolineales bacterium]